MSSLRTSPSLWVAAAFLTLLTLGAVGAVDPGWSLVMGALLPTLMWVAYVRSWDYKEPEPWSLVALAFVVGVFSVLLAAAGEVALETGDELLDAAVVAPLVEEASKPLGLYILWRNVELDDELDAVFYAVTSGMGFAFVENLLYEAGPLSSGVGEWALVAAVRGLSSTVGHACYTSLTGFGLAAVRFEGSWDRFLILYPAAAFLHGAGNALVMIAAAADSPELMLLALVLEPIVELLILRWVVSSAARLSPVETPLTGEGFPWT